MKVKDEDKTNEAFDELFANLMESKVASLQRGSGRQAKGKGKAKGHGLDGRTSTPVKPKRVWLIRHGESMGQAARSLGLDRRKDATLIDADLTQKGVQQAYGIPNLLDVQQVCVLTVVADDGGAGRMPSTAQGAPSH